ncbi:hypothetical protein G6L40_29115 [Rhizobium lusitanum]|jgi:hypothetical protein|nr:hypothetical protein [Rhizobium lusitanum]
MSETAFLGVWELGRLYRDGTLSPVEATRQVIECMERLEPKLNAVSHIVATAMQDAERLAVDLRSGHDLGALHGIPVAISDLIEVKDTPTGFGVRIRRDMGNDLAAIGIQHQMQLSPATARPGVMLLLQPGKPVSRRVPMASALAARWSSGRWSNPVEYRSRTA